MLRRKDLVKALAERGREVRVADAMCRDCPTVYADHPLERTLEKLRESDCAAVPVMSGDEMVGLLTLENISELVMVNAALESGCKERIMTVPAESSGPPARRALDSRNMPKALSAFVLLNCNSLSGHTRLPISEQS
jgi:predicted transcriptional regulator